MRAHRDVPDPVWDANDALLEFVEDEPDSMGDVFVEPFDVVVTAHEDTPS